MGEEGWRNVLIEGNVAGSTPVTAALGFVSDPARTPVSQDTQLLTAAP